MEKKATHATHAATTANASAAKLVSGAAPRSGGSTGGATPRMEVVEATTSRCVLRFAGVRAEVVAALRVTMLSQVPALAIDDVQIDRNTSATPSMRLVDRVSQLVLDSREAVDALIDGGACDACEGRGCGACAVAYTLDIRNDDTKRDLRVTQLDLRPERLARAGGGGGGGATGTMTTTTARRGRVLQTLPRPVLLDSKEEDPVVIADLGPQERIRLRAQASIGTQQRHARWAVCGPISVRAPVEIRIDDDVVAKHTTVEQRRALVAACPRKVFALSADEHGVTAPGVDRCIRCDRCVRLVDSDDWRPSEEVPPALTLRERPDEFVMTIHAVGQLPAVDVFSRALAILQTQAADLDDWARSAS